jgi:hypothetical protein
VVTVAFVFVLVFSLFSVLSFVGSVDASTQTFGYTTIGTLSAIGLDDTIVGSIFTCSANGTVANMRAYIQGNGVSVSSKTAIYYSNLTHLASSNNNPITHSGGTWKTYYFADTINLTAGTQYILVVWADDAGSSYPRLAYDAGNTDQGYIDSETYTGTFPNPLVPSNSNYKYSIYCTIDETFSYNYYFYGLYDEDTGLVDGAVNVTAYWDDGTAPETFEVDGSSYQGFDSSPEHFFFELGSVDREYWLSADEGDDLTTSIYVFNASLTSYTLTFYDWTGALSTYSWVSAIRNINGTEVVVDKRKVDEEIKVVMGLEMYKKYSIELEAIVGTTYTWGELSMTSDTSVKLVVKGTEFPQDVIQTYRYVRVYGYREAYNTSHDSIVHLYEDTQEATSSVNVTIYYGNDTVAHSYLYSDTDSFTYTWSEADNETSYYSVVTITHATYGVLVFRQSFLRGFDDAVFDLSFLGSLPSGADVNSLLPTGILLVITLAFSALTSGIGGIVVVGFAGIMDIMGWIDFDANLLVLTVILAVMYAVFKNYQRVTMR